MHIDLYVYLSIWIFIYVYIHLYVQIALRAVTTCAIPCEARALYVDAVPWNGLGSWGLGARR